MRNKANRLKYKLRESEKACHSLQNKIKKMSNTIISLDTDNKRLIDEITYQSENETANDILAASNPALLRAMTEITRCNLWETIISSDNVF